MIKKTGLACAVFLFFLLFPIVVMNAQKFDLGKVSLKELQEKSYTADTSAVAAILYNKAKTYFRYDRHNGFTAYHEYEFRIKIYKKDGLKWANFEVPYYVGYETLNNDYVKFSNGVTYNIENGEIAKTKLSGEGNFRQDVNELWKVASITMPNVKVGSVIEFKYTLRSEDLMEFPIFHFQYPIPVAFSEYRTEIPALFIYKPTIIGFGDVKSDAKIVDGFQNFSNENQQSVNISYQQINSVYSAQNMPALGEEDYVDNIENYRSSVVHELEKTRFPDVPEKNYSTTWDGVAKTIYKDKRFGAELGEWLYIEKDVPAIISNATTDTEKVTAIFEFVKRSMHWDGKYGYNTRKGVKKAWQERTGNVAEINFILIAMLNQAGINANPVLVSTIQHGIPVFPNLTVFNYVVAAAGIEGKQMLLDATDKYATGNILPAKALNWTGRLIRRDGSSQEINLVPESQSKETVTLMAKIDAQGKISGKGRIQKADYTAYDFRESNAALSNDDYIGKLESSLGGIQISEYKSENINLLSKPVTETFTFVSDNHVEIIGGKLFVNPLLFFTQAKNPFVQETRQLPVYYAYPKQTKYNISIEIPEGYALESFPKSMTITTGENVGVFVFNLLESGNKIQIVVTKEINLPLISASFYPNLKEYYQKMIEKQHEKIILKKL